MRCVAGIGILAGLMLAGCIADEPSAQESRAATIEMDHWWKVRFWYPQLEVCTVHGSFEDCSFDITSIIAPVQETDGWVALAPSGPWAAYLQMRGENQLFPPGGGWWDTTGRVLWDGEQKIRLGPPSLKEDGQEWTSTWSDREWAFEADVTGRYRYCPPLCESSWRALGDGPGKYQLLVMAPLDQPWIWIFHENEFEELPVNEGSHVQWPHMEVVDHGVGEGPEPVAIWSSLASDSISLVPVPSAHHATFVFESDGEGDLLAFRYHGTGQGGLGTTIRIVDPDNEVTTVEPDQLQDYLILLDDQEGPWTLTALHRSPDQAPEPRLDFDQVKFLHEPSTPPPSA